MQEQVNTTGSISEEHAGRYLSFVVKDESYGFAILRVREIIGMQSITRVPGARGFIKGVINLRGKVIPIVDMRLRFSLPEAEQTEETCIIIVEIDNSETGFIVDAVAEVLNFPPEAIEPPPAFQADSDAVILAMGKANEKVVLLLDVDRLLQKVA